MDALFQHRLHLTVLGLVLICASPGRAAYLESSTDAVRDHRRPPVIAPPAPVPPPDGTVAGLIRRLRVGNGVRTGDLTVFPLYADGGGHAGQIRTMDEALRRGWLAIREAGSARVPRVEVSNRSRHHVFLMSGEVIAGGKQNRMIRHDVLLPPRSETISVPVYCVERDRWSHSVTPFKGGDVLTYPELRRKAAGAESQESIWQSIDTYRRRSRIDSATGDYLDLASSPALASRLDAAAKRLRPVLTRRSVGAVAMSGNQVIAVDVFSDPRLFAQLWSKICRSYGIQVLQPHRHDRRDERLGHQVVPEREAVRRLLDQALGARVAAAYTPGAGRRLVLSGAVEGGALIWGGDVVHMAFWPGRIWIME